MKLLLLLAAAALVGVASGDQCSHNLTSAMGVNWEALQGVWYSDSYIHADNLAHGHTASRLGDLNVAGLTCIADKIHIGYNRTTGGPYAKLTLHDSGLNFVWGESFFFTMNATDDSLRYTGYGWFKQAGVVTDYRVAPWTDYKTYLVLYECLTTGSGQDGRVIILARNPVQGVGHTTRQAIFAKLHAKGWSTNGVITFVPWTDCQHIQE